MEKISTASHLENQFSIFIQLKALDRDTWPKIKELGNGNIKIELIESVYLPPLIPL
jgi:hypothetical protein